MTGPTAVKKMTPPVVTVPEDISRERAYLAERDQVLRLRLDITLGLFVVLLGVAMAAESSAHPDRAAAVLWMYGLTVLGSGAGALAYHLRIAWAAPARVGAVLMAAFALLISYYEALVGSSADSVAAGHLCHLLALAVLLPWGWRPQLFVTLAAMLGGALAFPHLPNPGGGWSPVTTAMTGVMASIVGSALLDRYRRTAFMQAALFEEEAEISGALVEVGETLSAHLDAPDMLEQVNRLARASLGCDWSITIRWDPERRTFRLHSAAGVHKTVRTELAQLEFPFDSMPLFAALTPGETIEIVDASDQCWVPPRIMRRAGASSALCTPVCRQDQITALLMHGYRTRTGPFTIKQRRLSRGIAHATAVAVENASLIADLQAASRLKSDFVSTMSHELRTPLNVISGYADLLVEGTFDPLTTAQQGTVERVRRSARELLDLVTATLDLNRLDAGRDPVTATTVDVDHLFGELERELEPIVAPGVVLRWTRARQTPPLLTDYQKLKTILKNLIGNALKFTTRGQVDVALGTHSDGIALSVQDTGVGIAPADLPLIFDMFRQGDSSDSRQFGGVGLGLHIVRRLVTLLGGHVDAASTAGVGSTFTVVLPVSIPGRNDPATVSEPVAEHRV